MYSKADCLHALAEIHAYLDNHSDVVDGEDGHPKANTTMYLLHELEQVKSAIKKRME